MIGGRLEGPLSTYPHLLSRPTHARALSPSRPSLFTSTDYQPSSELPPTPAPGSPCPQKLSAPPSSRSPPRSRCKLHGSQHILQQSQQADVVARAGISETTTTHVRSTSPAPPRSSAPGVKGDLNGSIIKRESREHHGSPIAARGAANMAAGKDAPPHSATPSRPSIVSYHSNSVPSTPYQHARDFGRSSRTPSPRRRHGSHSPRSVCSEGHNNVGIMSRDRRDRVPCKYETDKAFARRRFLYNIGSDILEKAAEEPKKALEPNEEEKLSGDMRELYDRLLPSAEGERNRKAIVKKLEDILHAEWPESEFRVHIFGSSGNKLCTNDSDVDVSIQTPMIELKTMCMLAVAMAKHGMQNVICIATARIPIVRIWDPELKLSCDVNVNEGKALENTRMIKTYVDIDERVRPLAMIIKHWARRRMLNDAGGGNTISSYTWICMILNFLQTRNPPILPALQQMPFKARSTQSGFASAFADDMQSLAGFGRANTETLGELLFHFFRKYAHEMNYQDSFISVREGQVLTKGQDKNSEKGWSVRLCVESPLEQSNNLGYSADEYSFRGIHLELRRAFELLADGDQLEKCCEQFEFPPPEPKPAFQKPQPVQKGIVPQPAPQPGPQSGRGGRGGGSVRGGRHHFNQKGNAGFRRSSNPTNFGVNGRYPFAQSPPVGNGPSLDYFAPYKFTEHLVHQYRTLGQQQENLQAMLRAVQAQEQAHRHAAAQVQAQGASSASVGGSPRRLSLMNGYPSPRIVEGAASGGTGAPMMYHRYPPLYDPASPMTPSASQEGVHTNPSSPTLMTSTPAFRRTAQRPSIVNGTQGNAVRSHSQPPRAADAPHLPSLHQNPQAFDAHNSPFGRPGYSYPQNFLQEQQSREARKEYLGYYYESPQQLRSQSQQFAVPPIPPYDILQRRRMSSQTGGSGLMIHPAGTRPSRSPSPLGHVKSYSTAGLRSAPLPLPNTPLEINRDETARPTARGPVIVNGSFPAPGPSENGIDSRGNGEPLAHQDAPPTVYSTGPPDALGLQYPMELTDPQRQQLYANELLSRHLAAESQAGVNGTHYVPSPIASGASSTAFSTGTQPFPDLSDAATETASVTRDVSPKGSPKPLQLTTSRSGSLPRGPIPPLDLSEPVLPQPDQSNNQGGALSPVYETCTPSPTAKRTSLVRNPSTGVVPLVNGSTAKENQQGQQKGNMSKPTHHHPQKSVSGPQMPTPPTPSSATTGSPTVTGPQNPWQTSEGKKGKKKGKRGQKSVSEPKFQGEPLPANVADRKGG